MIKKMSNFIDKVRLLLDCFIFI